jgi:hypothetical protein
MSNRRYLKPTITRVDLRPEEAVLNGCKIQGQLVGFQNDSSLAGHCYELYQYPGGPRVGIGLCQEAGT